MNFEQIWPIAQAAAESFSTLSPWVLLAVWWLESRWEPTAVNTSSLATGLGQVMPKEAGSIFSDRPTMDELKDPETNATGPEHREGQGKVPQGRQPVSLETGSEVVFWRLAICW